MTHTLITIKSPYNTSGLVGACIMFPELTAIVSMDRLIGLYFTSIWL